MGTKFSGNALNTVKWKNSGARMAGRIVLSVEKKWRRPTNAPPHSHRTLGPPAQGGCMVGFGGDVLMNVCPVCDGFGSVFDIDPVLPIECPKCEGSGEWEQGLIP